MDDRERLTTQTARNLEGMELERSGRVEEAFALYRANIDEGFEGDWPYGRLVAAYEKGGELERAVEVLERAIAVFSSSKRRTPSDRRATVQAFKGRLRLVKRAIAERDRPARARRKPKTGVEAENGRLDGQ
jgi:tetratricopeptide (TPR) repeat protein